MNCKDCFHCRCTIPFKKELDKDFVPRKIKGNDGVNQYLNKKMDHAKFWGPVRCDMGMWHKTDGEEKIFRKLVTFNRLVKKSMRSLTNDGRCEHFMSMDD